VAGLAYQKGFGGHFHNDNSFAVLRDVPGLVIAAPGRGDDAAGMLRTAAALARVDGRVVAFLEPIALYMTKDLYEEGDGGWLCRYPALSTAVPLGEARVYREGEGEPALAILSYANGAYLSLRAARRLYKAQGIRSRVVDLRWLAPLDRRAISEAARAAGRVLIVDEGRRTGGLCEALCAILSEEGLGHLPCEIVAGVDTYIPLGDAAYAVLPSEAEIERRALAMVRGEKRRAEVAE
jgi:2-oxoisovalerate dehydrogenase E1 component